MDEILSFIVFYCEKKKKDKDSVYVHGSPVWVQCGVNRYIKYSVVGVEKDYPFRYLVESCDVDQDRINFLQGKYQIYSLNKGYTLSNRISYQFNFHYLHILIQLIYL